jgi:hypothetical protein
MDVNEQNSKAVYRVIRYEPDLPEQDADMAPRTKIAGAMNATMCVMDSDVNREMEERVLLPGRYTARVVNAFTRPMGKNEVMVMDLMIEEGEFAGMRVRKAYRPRSGAAKAFWAKELTAMGVSTEGDATAEAEWVELIGMQLIIRVDIQVNGNMAAYVAGRAERL